MKLIQVVVFALAVAFCFTPWASPPLALALGLAIAFTVGHPFPKFNSKVTKILLQTSVVLLGFGMNLQKVLQAGRQGILFTVATIVGTLFLGYIVGRMLGMEGKVSHLISSGTAICGGSAIAAVGPVLHASDEEMSVSLGTIFVLNAVALFIFPAIGHHLGLSQTQFGVWAAIAIHDTSSVVGAAAKYGAEALQIATAIKLTRALWIVPLTIGTALFLKQKNTRITIPWFILGFVVASVVRTYLPGLPIWSALAVAAKIGLTITLLLIGAGLSPQNLRAVGLRPLLLGLILWIAISTVSLAVIRATI